MILDVLDLEIPIPSLIGVVGWLIASLAVAALIGGVCWIFSLGA